MKGSLQPQPSSDFVRQAFDSKVLTWLLCGLKEHVRHCNTSTKNSFLVELSLTAYLPHLCHHRWLLGPPKQLLQTNSLFYRSTSFFACLLSVCNFILCSDILGYHRRRLQQQLYFLLKKKKWTHCCKQLLFLNTISLSQCYKADPAPFCNSPSLNTS